MCESELMKNQRAAVHQRIFRRTGRTTTLCTVDDVMSPPRTKNLCRALIATVCLCFQPPSASHLAAVRRTAHTHQQQLSPTTRLIRTSVVLLQSKHDVLSFCLFLSFPFFSQTHECSVLLQFHVKFVSLDGDIYCFPTSRLFL